MRLLHLAAVLALAACAGPRGPHANVPKNAWVDEDPETGEELVCQDERTTGTNMSKVVCRTQDEIDEERNAAMVWETNRRLEHAKKF
ncbi:MAG TPA: hypothetical protein VF516_08400 [Kofleriaceae bacterium]